MTKTIQPADLAGLLKPGMTVFIQGSTGEPTVLLSALAEAGEASRGVHYVGCFLAGVNTTDPAAFHDEASATVFFVYGPFEESYNAGKLRLVPAGYRSIYAYMERLPPVDLALIQTSPPNPDGDYTLGLAVDFQPAVLDQAGCVVAEVNHAMPAASGSCRIPASRIDYAVESERPVISLETGELGNVAERIGRNVASLVEDGAAIQIGIGKLPAAILKALGDRRDLGLQGGMVADGCIELVEKGVMTGARKTVEPGRMVCGCALGSQRLYDWLSERDDVLYRPASYTHETRVIGEIDNFFSINSVLEVDLLGQANAEMLAGRQVSGTGGLMDFVRGARMSRGGKSILAIESTAARGRFSRIVPRLGTDGVVSCARGDIDHVVTEHGIAALRDKSIGERADALIAIADPAFQGELEAAWRKAQGVKRWA